MKVYLVQLLALCLFVMMSSLSTADPVHETVSLINGIGSKPKECSKGQGFWCQNITTATYCGAMKHCIQAVWEREVPFEKDKSEVCQICLDMVKQARDQLRSNETQADLKAVLDGSCNLIPIKIVREACLKFMEEFATQVIDTLSSQMNPQVVCSVAGLCNNARIHLIEKEYLKNKLQNQKVNLNCGTCYNLMDIVRNKLNSVDKIVTFLMEMCSSTGSYSDGCMALVIKHVNEIDNIIKDGAHAKPICSMAGVCREVFHNHNKSLVRESISSSSVDVPMKGDLPCDLCTQLVLHLRNILIANTTEAEFKLVLHGLCNQMKTYKDECNNLVNEYYGVVYQFLVNELNGKTVCKEIGLCPKVEGRIKFLRPLFPAEMEVFTDEHAKQINDAQLPVERLNPLTIIPSSFLERTNNHNKAVCAMCEYFLHFVQQEITLPSNEKRIREIVMKGCDRLPKTISTECDSFVQTYMDAFIALLANQIDPSQVCPSLGVCPGDLLVLEYKDKPTCPLCLLAMDEINRKAKDANGSLEKINDILDDLCMRDVFPNPLLTECAKFVLDNRKSIVDMVVTEFTPQESCVYVNLCIAPDLKEKAILPAGDIETNEISDGDSQEHVDESNKCALCEFILTKIDKELEDKKFQDDVKDVVYKVCSHMPATLSKECKNFVNQYGDLVIELLVQEINPKEVCTYLNFCGKASVLIVEPMKKCLLCELMMDGLRTVLTNEDVDENINQKLEKACGYIPKAEQNLCLSLIIQLAPQVEAALRSLPVGPLICKRIHMCHHHHMQKEFQPVLGGKNCLIGSAYWCQSTQTAAACGNIQYCQKNVWRGMKPKKNHYKGTIVIKY